MTVISEFSAVRAAHIILASASPRRVEILNTILGLEARVVPSTFPEDLDKSQFTPISYVQENARQKALEVRSRLIAAGEAPPSVVVGADTVVDQGGAILEKPKSEAQATEMLGRLSGSTHAVHTGVALLYRDGSEACFCESSEVNFCDLAPEDIAAYVASGEPMDKAGAYGIQGLGGAFVTGIRGCYYNVMGFPMHKFCATLDVARLGAES